MKQVLNFGESTNNLLLMAGGLILFLFALGIFSNAFRILIGIIGVFMVIYGFIHGGYLDRVMAAFHKKH